jgi:hypothetical protein
VEVGEEGADGWAPSVSEREREGCGAFPPRLLQGCCLGPAQVAEIPFFCSTFLFYFLFSVLLLENARLKNKF